MKRILSRASSWLLAALVLTGMPAGAQTPAAPPAEQPPASAFGEQIEVRVVNVEAVVTDRNGNRVVGLKPEDFILLVDGKEVPVEYFSEVRGGLAIEGPSEEGPVPGLPGLAPGSPVGTSYLVFIDDFFSVGTRRNEVLKQLEDKVAQLGPEDRMAIVAYDGRKLEMLSSWSRSERDLGRAFSNARARRAYGLERMSELRMFETSRRTGVNQGFGPRSAFSDRLDFDEREYSERLTSQIRKVVSASVSTLRGFASPPGRKVMILLSGGWPANPAQYAVDNPERQVFSGDAPRDEELFQPLTDAANRIGYTIYTVDVPGLANETVDASSSGSNFNGARDTGIFREQEVHSALHFVAEETGGQPLINANRAKAFETAEADTRSYYWLGFTPQWQGNDQRHDVKLQVRMSDLKVRTRDNYFDLSRRAEASMMVESAMLFGAAPGSAALPVKIGTPVSSGRREMTVPITVAIPVDAISVVPLDGKYVSELELRVASTDQKGNSSDIPVIPIRLSFDKQPEAGKYIPYSVSLKLRQLDHDLVLAVSDPSSNSILTANAEVAVPGKKRR